jgi:uncharacterized spore protein YtfJ
MNIEEILRNAQEAMHVRRVFSEPIHVGDITLVPAAIVRGGGGGGGSSSHEGGAGFGLKARPAGAFVIKSGEVSWRPAINVNQIIAGGQLVAIAAIFLLRPLFFRSALAKRLAERTGS